MEYRQEKVGETKLPQILISPISSAENGYVSRFVEILASIGNVYPVPSLKSFSFWKRVVSRNRVDHIVVGWLENDVVRRDGRFSRIGFWKALVKVFLYRLLAKRLVFVKHNLYPHGTREIDIQRTKSSCEFLERLFDVSIVHSPHLESKKCIYVPHPLYKVLGDEPLPSGSWSADLKGKKYFVVFGRVERYKNIHSLLAILPDDVNLVVMGRASDPVYLAELKKTCRNNVIFISEFVSDELAKNVIVKSSGVVLCHQEPNVVVSGTFFYSISLGIKVFGVATPFLAGVEPVVGKNKLYVFESLDELSAGLHFEANASPLNERQIGPGVEAFSDELIREKMTLALNC